MPRPSFTWRGVFPAITTQMKKGGALDLDRTATHVDALIRSGVQGIVFLGSLGENQMLAPDEKRLVIAEMVRAVGGRVPVVSGVAETSTAEAVRYARDVAEAGAVGLMVMPAMSYRTPDPDETLAHFRAVARSVDLSVMIYNNPLSYGNDVTPAMFEKLAALDNVHSIKESSGDTRRITDLRNAFGDRFAIFSGVDDLVLESAVLGIDGWIAGTGIAFPEHNQRLWDLIQARDWPAALELYRWFTPLLHLDVSVKFVQNIKLCVQERGLGVEWTRPPRLPLSGAERKRVLEVIRTAVETMPKLPRKKSG